MFARLFLVFITVSLLEIFVLLKVGSFLGAWPTVGLVVVTAVMGSALVRSQGIELVKQLQQRIAQGEMPGVQLIEGGILLFAGVLLITPGFVTDFCGLLLLQPAIRGRLAKAIVANLKLNTGAPISGYSQPPSGSFTRENRDKNIIEGEFERKDDEK